MTIATWCRRCGSEFTADRAAILAGRWRLCPDCRAKPAPVGRDEPPRVATAGTDLTRQNTGVQR